MLELYYQFFEICTCITFITESSCPFSFTSFITMTCHVVTCSFFYTTSCALLTTINAIPSFSTFCSYITHSSSLKWLNFIKQDKLKIITNNLNCSGVPSHLFYNKFHSTQFYTLHSVYDMYCLYNWWDKVCHSYYRRNWHYNILYNKMK